MNDPQTTCKGLVCVRIYRSPKYSILNLVIRETDSSAFDGWSSELPRSPRCWSVMKDNIPILRKYGFPPELKSSVCHRNPLCSCPISCQTKDSGTVPLTERHVTYGELCLRDWHRYLLEAMQDVIDVVNGDTWVRNDRMSRPCLSVKMANCGGYRIVLQTNRILRNSRYGVGVEAR